jgi:hypothetical protein
MMKGFFGAAALTLIIIGLSGCLAMNPKPEGFREVSGLKRLVVPKTFQFTIVSGLAKAKAEITVPEGVYQQIGSDVAGDYYMSATGRIPIRTFFPDSLSGGIYRRNSSPPAYFIFSTSRTGMDFMTHGQYPKKHEQIPSEFGETIVAK